LGPWAATLYYGASGLFLFLVYSLWSQQFPWYVADSNLVGDYLGYLDHFQLLCWLSVVAMLALSIRLGSPKTVSKSQYRLAIGLTLLILLTVPPPQKSFIGLPRPDRRTLANILVRDELALAANLYRLARYGESIAVVRHALQPRPVTGGISPSLRAVGLNIMAKSSASLHLWDQAIDAASDAIRLDPSLKEANENLTWILEQKDRTNK
jgi:hypothetical protein